MIGHAGEYFALVLFGAVGMMLMTSATELLVIFVGLEISSIATYIICGFRKGIATGTESSIKYFLLGSFATAFFLYGIALIFGATGSTNLARHRRRLSPHHQRAPRLPCHRHDPRSGIGFKVSAAPFHVWTPDVYQGAPAPVVGLMSTAPKAAAFAVLLRILFSGFPAHRAPLVRPHLDPRRPLHVYRQPGRIASARRQAHARVLVDRARRLPARRLHRLPAGRHRRRYASTPPPTPP